MFRVIVFRIATFVPSFLLVLIISLLLTHISPTSPASHILGDNATPERESEINHALGLDRPFLSQMGDWMGGAIKGDFGTSLFSSARVSDVITDRIWPTLSLALVALTFAALLGILPGLLAALHRGGALDRLLTAASALGLAVPSFWLGLVLSYQFGVRRQWFPVLGYEPLSAGPWPWFRGLLLPGLCIALPAAAALARHSRTSLIDVLASDYIRTAIAKGLPMRRVVRRHALKNAAIPIVTLIGNQFVVLLGGTVIIESVFSIPGVGSLAVESALQKNIPVVQGIVVYSALVVLVANLTVDVLHVVLDPRLRT